MKLGQLLEYNLRNVFLQKSCRKWGSFCCFLLKALYKFKGSGQNLSFNVLIDLYLDIDLNISDSWSWDVLNFNFL